MAVSGKGVTAYMYGLYVDQWDTVVNSGLSRFCQQPGPTSKGLLAERGRAAAGHFHREVTTPRTSPAKCPGDLVSLS